MAPKIDIREEGGSVCLCLSCRRGKSRPVRAAARHCPTTVATGAVVIFLGVHLRNRELRCY